MYRKQDGLDRDALVSRIRPGFRDRRGQTPPRCGRRFDVGIAAAPRSPFQRGLGRVTDDLSREFAGTFTQETISRFVGECHGMVTAFLMPSLQADDTSSPRTVARVSSLTRRFARERLGAMAQSHGLWPKVVPEVLFVCAQDGGRSQLAAALMRRWAGERVHVRSAGSSPAPAIHPEVVEVLAEVGLDVAGAYPKPLTDEAVRAADVVVTLGCGTAARSIRTSGTRTGPYPTPPREEQSRPGPSATTSPGGCAALSSRWAWPECPGFTELWSGPLCPTGVGCEQLSILALVWCAGSGPPTV